MGNKLLHYSFPYVVAFFILMLVAYGVGAADVLIGHFFPQFKDFIPSTSIPFDVIGWFYAAIASVYCGGSAMLNIFTSKSLGDLKQLDVSMENLRKITYMNYVGCAFCLGVKLVGADIPIEAIVSSTGACTILIVASKKGSETSKLAFKDEDNNGVDDVVEALMRKLDERKASGLFVDERKSGRDDVVEDLERRIAERKAQIKAGGLLKTSEKFKA
jgi:hypothetical protein